MQSRNRKTAVAVLGAASLATVPGVAAAQSGTETTVQAIPGPEIVQVLKAEERAGARAKARQAKLAKAKKELVLENAALAKALKKERGEAFRRARHIEWVDGWGRGRLRARNDQFEDKLVNLRSASGGAVTATSGAEGGKDGGSGSAPSGQLASIAACESGGDPGAIGGGGAYRGKYQFSPSTWQSVGGSGDPAAAPEAEQDKRAAMLLARDGAGHWPVCG